MISPWARLTRRMMPKIKESPTANSAYTPPSSMPSNNVSIPPTILCSEIGRANGVLVHFRGPAGQRHPPLLQTIKPVAMPQRAGDILLDDHDAGAVGADQG